jgi:transglutaminase-like putative cysteine protease
MKLRISHITSYQYANPVTDSVNEIRLTPCSDVAAFTAETAADEQEVRGWLKRLSGRICNEYEYDPWATDVQTKVSAMMIGRRGVCQDFAHLMITACRIRRIPARYVSGYHFVGDLQGGNADFEQSSHAWVEAFVPGIGWTGFDPTNDAAIGERYVKLGHGRDYRDIVPVKGVYRGAGDQKLKVTVDVRKIED